MRLGIRRPATYLKGFYTGRAVTTSPELESLGSMNILFILLIVRKTNFVTISEIRDYPLVR